MTTTQPDMDERQKKAFDFVSDYTKQLITLSTGIITVMVTFLSDELKSGGTASKILLVLSWLLFTLSICFGIMRLMALTGNLDPVKAGTPPNLTITSPNVRNTGGTQIVLFLAGLALSMVFGFMQLFWGKKAEKEKAIIILQQPAPVAGKVVKPDTVYPVKPRKPAVCTPHHKP
jgi:ABC-type uncharacterized transport system YnjBCD permease subunit